MPGLGISTGIYNPPSGAIPRRTASKNVTGAAVFRVETPVSVLGVCDVLDIGDVLGVCDVLDIGDALGVRDVLDIGDALGTFTDNEGVWEAV